MRYLVRRHGCPSTWIVPFAFSSSVATASASCGPRSMPMYHAQLNSTARRSLAPGAGVYRAGGPPCRCAATPATQTAAIAIVIRILFMDAVQADLKVGPYFKLLLQTSTFDLRTSGTSVPDLRDHVVVV